MSPPPSMDQKRLCRRHHLWARNGSISDVLIPFKCPARITMTLVIQAKARVETPPPRIPLKFRTLSINNSTAHNSIFYFQDIRIVQEIMTDSNSNAVAWQDSNGAPPSYRPQIKDNSNAPRNAKLAAPKGSSISHTYVASPSKGVKTLIPAPSSKKPVSQMIKSIDWSINDHS